MTGLRRRAHLAVAAIAAGTFVLAAWHANRSVCEGCTMSEVRLSGAEARPLRGRLYLPADTTAPLPAVVVLHGHLANLAFVEVPWVSDLTALGCAVLLVDRPGHGRSGGSWWPRDAPEGDASVDATGAALAYLRRLPGIDPARLAVLGHSDGGTAAIVAGASDWTLRATVAISASVAPALIVNHVAPRNLLLAYGREDRFVIDDTDTLLISAATRGYLAGPGRRGDLADGSARQLLELPERGHVDVLYSDAARRAVLDWLHAALSTDAPPATLAPDRRGWIATGALAIGVLLACGGGAAPHAPSFPRRAAGRVAVVIALWSGALLLAGWLRDHLPAAPGQEGGTVLALLGGTAAVLGATRALLALAVRRHSPHRRGGDSRRHRLLVDTARGSALGLVVGGGLLYLLKHLYDAPLGAGRWGLFALFLPAALAASAALEGWVTWVGGRPAGATALAGVALATGILAPWLFPRMSVLPVYLLAATVGLAACHRIGAPRADAIGGAVMAGVVYARLAAGVDALY